jgi:ABC-2 type transport system permease protein
MDNAAFDDNGSSGGARAVSPYRKPGFFHDWFLVSELVKRDFKARYDRSVLGMFWCVLQPTLTMGLLYAVFSVFFKSAIPNFPLYLISGIVFYQFFVETTTTAMRSIQENAGLITKVKVPLWTYPVTRAASSLVNFVFALVPLFAVVLLTRVPPRPTMLLLFFSTACMLVFALGIGLFLAALAVFFSDVKFLWSFACTLWMYATPIFYPEASLSGGHWWMVYFNPLYHVIHFSRAVLNGRVPPAEEFAVCALFTAVSLAAGLAVFRALKNKFALQL